MSAEDYAAMPEHMQAHQSGSQMMNDPAMDSMMHQMMDGMMATMMDGYHHASPTPQP